MNMLEAQWRVQIDHDYDFAVVYLFGSEMLARARYETERKRLQSGQRLALTENLNSGRRIRIVKTTRKLTEADGRKLKNSFDHE